VLCQCPEWGDLHFHTVDHPDVVWETVDVSMP